MPTPDYREFKDRREHSVWQSLNRVIITLIILVGLVVAALLFLPQMRSMREMAATRDGLTQEQERLKAQLQQHQRQANLLKTDPSYIETIMRDRLEMMKPGETIIRMDATSPAPKFTPTPTP